MRVLIVAILLLIAACGQKGQLYLPGPAQTDMSVPAEEASGAIQAEATDEGEGKSETDELEVKKDKND